MSNSSGVASSAVAALLLLALVPTVSVATSAETEASLLRPDATSVVERPEAVDAVAESSELDPGSAGESWGIEVISVRRTAADYMLDFRYRVVDADKALAIMDRGINPYLVQEKTGYRLQVPVSEKIGPLRQAPREATADKKYFMFFANPARLVKAGDKVTVVIGEFRQTSIVVE